MNVDKISFQARFLDIFAAIAEAHFVSFDLELSGVPVKQPGEASGKPSLQERYLEIKDAAEKYQILQVGITCVSEEDDRGVYVCKPFNFNLSPVLDEKRLDIDRTFSFHSGAVEFLLGVGFQIDLPFTSGVPYLSRSEAALALEKAATRNDRTTIADIHIKPEDTQSIAFLRRVRSEIASWLDDKTFYGHLIIGPVNERGHSLEVELTRFERRLVHQLVRAEYPSLITTPSRGLIRIMKFDQEREDRIKAERLREAKDRVDKQTGFRWIVEALAGNTPSQMDVKQFAVTPETGMPVLADLDFLRSRYVAAQQQIKGKKKVLVGHNMFLDLIYLYRTFFGPLPDTAQEFFDIIHELFPVVIDTKYMATHNCGDINPRSSLQEIADQLELQQYPLIETHKDHRKYEDTTAFHEAGYDSMLTAQIALRLSTKLEAAGAYVDDTSDPGSADEVGGVKLNGAAAAFTPGDKHSQIRITPVLTSAISMPIRELIGEGNNHSPDPVSAIRDDAADVESASTMSKSSASGSVIAIKTGAETTKHKKKNNNNNKKKKQHSKKNSALASPPQLGRFAHATAFDQLQDTAEEEDESDEEEILQFDDLPSSTAYAAAPVVADTDGASEGGIVKPEDWDTPWWRRETGKAMPRFDSDFWRVYGNKLRVFGTQEGVCLLAR